MLNCQQVGHRHSRNTNYINVWFGQIWYDQWEQNRDNEFHRQICSHKSNNASTWTLIMHINSSHKVIENVIMNKTWNPINLSNFTSIFVHLDHKLLHAINWMNDGIPSSKQDLSLTPKHLRGPILGLSKQKIKIACYLSYTVSFSANHVKSDPIYININLFFNHTIWVS